MDVDGATTDEEEGQVNDDTLIDYNEEDTTTATEAATKAAYLKDLRELFADKGKEYRAFLKIMITSSYYVNKVHFSPIWCMNSNYKFATYLNDKYLRLLEERKRLVGMSHKPFYDSVDLINDAMNNTVSMKG
jgi:hypothetical protein